MMLAGEDANDVFRGAETPIGQLHNLSEDTDPSLESPQP
jgi:hypothetical protein